jgi:hypothetical protein
MALMCIPRSTSAHIANAVDIVGQHQQSYFIHVVYLEQPISQRSSIIPNLVSRMEVTARHTIFRQHEIDRNAAWHRR